MRYVILLMLFTFYCQHVTGQIEPVQSGNDLIKKLKVKSVRTVYYDHRDTTKSKGKRLFEKHYNANGDIISKYLLSLWDVVSYEHTTTYRYDNNNRLVEETSIQKILNLGKRDEEYIEIFGTDPIHKKYVYSYDEKGQCVKEMWYTFGEEGFPANPKPSEIILYEYRNGLMVKETGSAPAITGDVISSQDYVVTYEHDATKNKVKELRVYTGDPSSRKKNVSWLYDDKGLLTEEIVEGGFSPGMSRTRYEYDSNGRKVRELIFVRESNQWEKVRSYRYDNTGNLILQDDDTRYDYYKNGLIKTEIWSSKESEEIVHFVTTYTFR